MSIVPLALAAAIAAAPASPPPSAGAPLPRTIQVTGEGHASAAPDVARVTIGVQARDASLAKATADANARMRKVLAALEKGGVAAKDVRTVRYDVEALRKPERSSEAIAVAGYVVTNQAEATVRDLAKLGALLDQAVAAGANAIEGLALDKEDTSAERAKALEAAVGDAREKAGAIAKAAGVTLGEVLAAAELAGGPIPVRQGFVAARAAGAVPVAAGELELVSSVDVTFAIR